MDPRNADRLTRKRTDPVERYREYVDFQFSIDGEGAGLREARHALAESGESVTTNEIVGLDVLLLVSLQELDAINLALLDDAAAQPLARWWWHLGKLRAGTYPADLLPPHLRAIYAPGHETA